MSRLAIPVARWIDAVIFDLGRQMRWSFLPPLMVYFAFGCSTVTAIVGTFFVKDFLDFSAAYLAGLAFWAGIPWALKMPLGHLVDMIWRWKALLIHLGAALVAASMVIMYLVLSAPSMMQAILPIGTWYIVALLLSPCGLVVQDAVADAMSVEAVPVAEADGTPIAEEVSKAMHTTMQTLGRFALIAGTVAVALVNIWMFSGIEALSDAAKAAIYARIYLIGLIIPVISVSGVILATVQRWLGVHGGERLPDTPRITPNPWYFIGGAGFVALTLGIGFSDLRFGQEIIFLGSMAIIGLMMRQLIAALPRPQARMLLGTALIIFVFRAVPRHGDGITWFNIDVLGFDQQFLSVLSLITSVLTLAGLVVLRPLIARKSIATIVALLSIAAGLLSLPNLGLYYGVHHWTAAMTGGIVDARFIAILDTAIESPLGQIAMIPMLAWIARTAPIALKATFFAVMASFTNLALSASSLSTRYLNEVFVVTRELRDASGAIIAVADYSQLGWLLITVASVSVLAPLLVIWMVQHTALRSAD